MDEQANYNEVMHNKLTKQKSWSLYKTLVNIIKNIEDNNRRLLDKQGFLRKVLGNQKQMMEMLKSQNNTTATTKETKSNLEKVLRNKVRSFRTLSIHEKTKKLILGSSIIARINPYEMPEDIEIQAYSGSTSEEKLAIASK